MANANEALLKSILMLKGEISALRSTLLTAIFEIDRKVSYGFKDAIIEALGIAASHASQSEEIGSGELKIACDDLRDRLRNLPTVS